MRNCALLAGVLLMIAASPAMAQPQLETVVDNLYNPCALAIQPETGHLFVADSGNLRVIRVVDGQAEEVITGFPKDIYGKGPMYDIGPLGLAFLDRQTLVVGGGGYPDGQELLRVYTIPDAGAKPIAADKMKASFSLEPNEQTLGEGNFYALAVNNTGIFATSNGDDTKGWVVRAERNGNNVVGFERYLATKEVVGVDAPVGITFSKDGHLVVGQMGEINIPGDSLLSFYNPTSKKLLLNLETGLFDITALAYSPRGQLYATDFAWMASEEGGLFQLISETSAGNQSINAQRVVSLDKPTAMAFGSDGALYISIVGTAQQGQEKQPGKVLRIAPGL